MPEPRVGREESGRGHAASGGGLNSEASEIETSDGGKRSVDGGEGRRSFWGSLLGNPLYARSSDALAGSARRRFVLLAALPVLWVAVAHVGPILQMLHVSFLDAYPPTVGVPPEYTLANWTSFFRERIYLLPFARTLVFATTLTLVTLLLTYPVAYYLARHVPRNRQMLLLLLLLIPFWVGEIVRTFAIMILLGNTGAVNLTLRTLGLIERPIPFMYTHFSLGMGIVYLTSLYMLLPLYSALEKLPPSYHEAAADLGAGPWTRLWRVTLPLTREGITSGCTLVFLISTGYYATPVLLGGPSTTVFAETVAGFFHVAGDQWPTGAAFSCLMLMTTLALSGLFIRVMGRDGSALLK